MRFDRRIAEDRRKLQNALLRLGATLFRKAETDFTPRRSGTPLFSAAVAVAKACGIQTGNLFDALAEKSGELRLEDIARAGNFFTRQVILNVGWSREDNGPLLGRLNDEKGDRFVALIPVSPRRYELFDPEGGVRVPVTRELEERLDPQAHTFYRPLPPKSLSIKDIIQFTLSGAWKDLVMVIGVGVAGALLALLIPVMTGVIVDTVIPEAARDELLQIGLILTVSVFATFMFQITRAIATVRMEGKMGSTLQAAVIDRLLALPAPFFRKFTAGDLANRAMGINRIRQILSGATLTTALTCVFSSFNLILMFFYGWKLALIGLGLILITFCISGALSVWMVRYQRQVFAIQGKNAGIVLQLLTGIAKLRMTGTEERAFGVWAKSFSEKKAIDFKSGKINAALDTATSFIPLVASMVIFWFFLKSEMTGLSTGHFLAFNAAFINFQNAVVQATLTFASLLHVIPLWERAEPILSTIPEVDEGKTAVQYLSGDLGVDHVFFRYGENGPRVLKDINLRVSPGEFVAVVGGSGSGKSTLLRILLGFEKPELGSVYYDGQDMEGLDIKGIRRQMGVVLQRGQVMPGSILENITGALNLTLDDAWEAARMVGLEEDIKAMPMGMHTVVSAGGGTFSGGQRQRLIIARAIVRRPRILFFDEATSALDNRTQAIVSKSIEKLNVTRLVIAHRLSTIMNADRIYVLEHGEMKESGTYDELMKKKGAFYELAKRQIA
jgi:ATP-binding cassette subfamily C protein